MIVCDSSIISNGTGVLFRYISDQELSFIKSKGYVESKNKSKYGGTYWTLLFTNDPLCAQNLLEIDPPDYRVASFPVKCIPRNVMKELSREDKELDEKIKGFLTGVKDADIPTPAFESSSRVSTFTSFVFLLDAPIPHTSVYDLRKGELV
ncbi:hypothetical protein [Metallosphaera javensis (ex Sakai et al. 2022)]|uniref:hypothetical protein n=1 Tax=Metallosphaera javensis (ex Sakai et al. 2022) TaxID=2775498 RepID=UPI00258EB8B4